MKRTPRHATCRYQVAAGMLTLTLTFHNLTNSSLVRSLPISEISGKFTNKFLRYRVHHQTNSNQNSTFFTYFPTLLLVASTP